MTIHLDLTGCTHAGLRLHPLAEMMAALHVMAEPEHHAGSSELLDRADRCLSESTRRQIADWTPLWSRYRCSLFFPRRRQPSATLDDCLEVVAAENISLFVRAVVHALAGTSRIALPEQVTGDDLLALQPTIARRSRRGEQLLLRLGHEPEAMRDELLTGLAHFVDEMGRELWQEHEDDLRAVANTLYAEQGRRSPGEVIAGLHPTARVSEDGQRVRLDKLQSVTVRVGDRPLFLLPSHFVDPHVTVKLEPSLPISIQFPARPGQGLVTVEQLRRRLAVLSSPERMELCRHLIGEPITTTDLALRMDTSAPQVSRMLAQFRDVGLLTSSRDGKVVRHRVQVQTIASLGYDVLATILR